MTIRSTFVLRASCKALWPSVAHTTLNPAPVRARDAVSSETGSSSASIMVEPRSMARYFTPKRFSRYKSAALLPRIRLYLYPRTPREYTIYERGKRFSAQGRKFCAKYKGADGTWKYIYRKTKIEAKKALRQALKDRDEGKTPLPRRNGITEGVALEDSASNRRGSAERILCVTILLLRWTKLTG